MKPSGFIIEIDEEDNEEPEYLLEELIWLSHQHLIQF